MSQEVENLNWPLKSKQTQKQFLSSLHRTMDFYGISIILEHKIDEMFLKLIL